MTTSDPAQRRIEDVARWLRATAYGRSQHPPTVLLKAAQWLTAPLDAAPVVNRCQRCREPLPPYRGRGRGRKVCESCRPPRLNQYRANMAPTGRVEA